MNLLRCIFSWRGYHQLQLFQAKKRIGSNGKELKYNEKAQYTEENIKDILETSELSLDEVKNL